METPVSSLRSNNDPDADYFDNPIQRSASNSSIYPGLNINLTANSGGPGGGGTGSAASSAGYSHRLAFAHQHQQQQQQSAYHNNGFNPQAPSPYTGAGGYGHYTQANSYAAHAYPSTGGYGQPAPAPNQSLDSYLLAAASAAGSSNSNAASPHLSAATSVHQRFPSHASTSTTSGSPMLDPRNQGTFYPPPPQPHQQQHHHQHHHHQHHQQQQFLQPVPFREAHSPFPLSIESKVVGGVQEAIERKFSTTGHLIQDPAEEQAFFEELDGPMPEQVRVALGKTRCCESSSSFVQPIDLVC